jgi:hypothetical protein
MADGSTKPIEQVRVEDKVLSRDVRTGKVAAKRVLRTFLSQAPATVALNVGGERIVSTPNHPFYVEGKGFIPAGQLKLGASIVTRAGPALKLAGMEPVNAATATAVYNFEVEDFHTYFVGKSGLWVHNLCDIPYGIQMPESGRKVYRYNPDGTRGDAITNLDRIIQDGDEYWIVEEKNYTGMGDPVAKAAEFAAQIERYIDALTSGSPDVPFYLGDLSKVHFGWHFTGGRPNERLVKEFEDQLKRLEIEYQIDIGVIWGD